MTKIRITIRLPNKRDVFLAEKEKDKTKKEETIKEQIEV